MASRYYYERPVDGYRPPNEIRDERAAYYDPRHVAFEERDPRHDRSSPSTSAYNGHHGARAVHDPYRRDWRDQDRGSSLNGRQGVVPAEEVYAHPNLGGWNGGFAHGDHGGRRTQNMPAHNPAHHLHERKTVSLWMPLCCDRCERHVKEQLQQIEGVEKVEANQVTRKVVVVGTMPQEYVLTCARQCKPQSVYWSNHLG